MGEILFPAWDPVILQLGPLQIRWYSVMYVVGFVIGHWVLTRMARARFFPCPEEKVPDLIFCLVFGVMLGGRLGYCLFYKPELLTSWRLIAVWEGGLSFHGGLLGVIVAAVLFARRQRVSVWRTLDCLAIAVTPGVLAVRIANFINGELYGRVTDASVPWAMRFPTDPKAVELLHLDPSLGIREREEAMRELLASGKWEAVRDQVPLRHPSQLYEAFGEGLLMGAVLFTLYALTKRRPLGSGVYGGVFALGYGLVRFVMEYFRQPDAQFQSAEHPIGTVLGPFTMGQVLCTGMVVYGLGAIWFRRNRREGLREP